MNCDKEISIRSALEADLQTVLDIQKSAFMRYTEFLSAGQVPPLNETFDELRKDFLNRTILVAEINNRLAGSVRFGIRGGVCILERLSVGPELQGNGIGRALVKAVESSVAGRAHKLYLETGLLADNLLLFYMKLGYSGEAVLRKHYGGFDWISFSKFIEANGTAS